VVDVLLKPISVVMQINMPNPGQCLKPVTSIVTVITLICLSCVVYPAIGQEADRVVLLDGSLVTRGPVTAIDANGQLSISGVDSKIDLQGLRRIERSVAGAAAKGGYLVRFHGGGFLKATSATVENEICQVDWAFGQGLNLPIDLVRAIQTMHGIDASKSPKGTENFEQSVVEDEGARDRLFVIVKGRLQSMTGLVEGIDQQNLKFNYQDESRQVSLSKVYGVVLAGAGKRPDRMGQCQIHLTDGSAVWGRVIGLADAQLQLQLSDQIKLQLPWSQVTRVDVRSSRMVFLSDLDPTSVRQQATATYPWPWQRDRSIFKNELRLRSKVYEKGLGTHADCTLEFAAGRKFDAFAAVIGIDDETHGKGDCIVVVIGDGKELFKKRIRGKDKPVDVRVAIKGVETVKLIVQQGENWDFSDHADWCDARFIREQ